jgi:uncharacterized membrane protein YfbV (UPF0208 family)
VREGAHGHRGIGIPCRCGALYVKSRHAGLLFCENRVVQKTWYTIENIPQVGIFSF